MPTPSPFYREIPLTQGQVALVDTSDYEWLSQWNWQAHWAKHTRSFYAVRTSYQGGHKMSINMHRLILGLLSGDPRKGDHANRNTLDNRRENLRIADSFQNAQNASRRSDNSSGYKGVCWHKPTGKWSAYINVEKRRVWGWLVFYSRRSKSRLRSGGSRSP